MIRTIFRSQLFLQEMWVLPFSPQRKDLHDDLCDLSDKSNDGNNFDAIEQWLVRQVFTLEIGVQSSVASPNLYVSLV